MSEVWANYTNAGASLFSGAWRLGPWNPPRYVYKPLKKGRFRLLHLLAGTADDSVIRVKLVDQAVDAAPEYHAISYTAGILCEGAEIRVTTNLFDALQRWRRADENVVVWADAVCIDQKNTQEKIWQIDLMKDIYERATSVLVWLGKDDAGLEGIETLIDAALKIIPEAVDDPTRNRESAATVAVTLGATGELDWAPLRSLLNHAWFERKWVFQEAVLNSQTWLYCGRLRLPFGPVSELGLRMATFHIFSFCINKPPAKQAPYQLRLFNLAIMRVSHWVLDKQPDIAPTTITAMDAIKATRFFKCTDVRDHILAVYGYATDGKSSSMLHDNLYLLPVQECYLRFTKAQLLEQRSLTVLAYAPQKVITDVAYPWWLRPYFRWQRRRLRGLPSWVPDFRHQELDSLPTYTFRHGDFSAGGAEAGTIEIINDKVLRCSGFIVDVVKDSGVFIWDLPLPPKPARVPYLMSSVNDLTCRNAIRSRNYFRACVRLSSPSGSEDIRDLTPERLSCLWKTMTGERTNLSDRVDVDWSEQFKAYVTGLDTWLTSEDPDESERGWRGVTPNLTIEQSVNSFGGARIFSTTAEGRLCMAPKETRVGDVVCVLLGSEVPFVIRPTRQGMYELIGEAYVSGIMDGEALSGQYDQVDIMLE
ncbi:hypothetical protein PspLS_01816 [Pyricularia sp. CBS 133598]|nr:hypothetical protein PspLS_01816 [Pyricularia sp. CBS 133598]